MSKTKTLPHVHRSRGERANRYALPMYAPVRVSILISSPS